MRLIHRVAELREALRGEQSTAFVPTMGNLHAGHLSLIDIARRQGGPVVASIFVNPLQFGAGEDYARYPRTLAADCAQLQGAGCDIVFAPDVEEMYPQPQTFAVLPPLADDLCGAHRPGHFQGVATVVLKLFNMVAPRYAVFGRKDYQQLFILQAMARQFNLPITVLAGDTGREDDGLALSSRNGFLTAAERGEAPRLYAALRQAAQRLAAGERDYAAIADIAAAELSGHGWQVDYVSVRARADLLPPTTGTTELVVLAAARLGNTRLIDNVEVDVAPA